MFKANFRFKSAAKSKISKFINNVEINNDNNKEFNGHNEVSVLSSNLIDNEANILEINTQEVEVDNIIKNPLDEGSANDIILSPFCTGDERQYVNNCDNIIHERNNEIDSECDQTLINAETLSTTNEIMNNMSNRPPEKHINSECDSHLDSVETTINTSDNVDISNSMLNASTDSTHDLNKLSTSQYQMNVSNSQNNLQVHADASKNKETTQVTKTVTRPRFSVRGAVCKNKLKNVDPTLKITTSKETTDTNMNSDNNCKISSSQFESNNTKENASNLFDKSSTSYHETDKTTSQLERESNKATTESIEKVSCSQFTSVSSVNVTDKLSASQFQIQSVDNDHLNNAASSNSDIDETDTNLSIKLNNSAAPVNVASLNEMNNYDAKSGITEHEEIKSVSTMMDEFNSEMDDVEEYQTFIDEEDISTDKVTMFSQTSSPIKSKQKSKFNVRNAENKKSISPSKNSRDDCATSQSNRSTFRIVVQGEEEAELCVPTKAITLKRKVNLLKRSKNISVNDDIDSMSLIERMKLPPLFPPSKYRIKREIERKNKLKAKASNYDNMALQSNSPSAVDVAEDPETMFDIGPKLRIDMDGNIVEDITKVDEVDNRSLNARGPIESFEDGQEFQGSYHRFVKKRLSGKKWLESETMRFYMSLPVTKTNFDMMVTVFDGTRSREDLKRKFKREMKSNPAKVELAMRKRSRCDLDSLVILLRNEKIAADTATKNKLTASRQKKQQLRNTEKNCRQVRTRRMLQDVEEAPVIDGSDNSSMVSCRKRRRTVGSEKDADSVCSMKKMRVDDSDEEPNEEW